MQVLTDRKNFQLATRYGRRLFAVGLTLQVRKRRDDEPEATDAVRIGFTASKKVGNAVARNRAKRRMRELARAVLLPDAKPGFDYVLIAKPQTVTEDFAAMQASLAQKLTEAHQPRPRDKNPGRGRPGKNAAGKKAGRTAGDAPADQPS